MKSFTLWCLIFKVLLLACHVPELDNGIANALFFTQTVRFHQLGLVARSEAEAMPTALCDHGRMSPNALKCWEKILEKILGDVAYKYVYVGSNVNNSG